MKLPIKHLQQRIKILLEQDGYVGVNVLVSNFVDLRKWATHHSLLSFGTNQYLIHIPNFLRYYLL